MVVVLWVTYLRCVPISFFYIDEKGGLRFGVGYKQECFRVFAFSSLFRVVGLKTRNQPETRKPETRNPKPETRNPKHETNQKPPVFD